MSAEQEEPLPVAEQWFRRETFPHGVTLLSEPYVDAFARCNIWHLRGRDRDLLIDTGLGLCSLREAASDLLERPVTAVLTHSHFDHIGGAFEFESRVAHPIELAEMQSPRGFRGLTAEALGNDLIERLTKAGYSVPATLLTALPYAGFQLHGYEVESAPLSATLDEGDVVDLGNRSFEVLHLPGHSPGSIALWEAKTGILFSGDAVYDGPLLYDLPDSSVIAYISTLRRLLSLEIETVHAGHDPSFGRERLHEIARSYLKRWNA